MKIKNLLLVSLALIGYNMSMAQMPEVSPSENKYSFGFKVFPNFSSLKTVKSATSDFYETTKAGGLTGFGFGAVIDYRISSNYYLMTGVNVVTGGGQLSVKSQNDNNRGALDLKSGEITYRMQYIELPLGIKMYNPIGEKINAYANIGVQLAFNIGKRARYDNIVLYDSLGIATSSSDFEPITGLSMTPTMFGMNLGAGVVYNLNENLDGLLGLSFTNYFLPDITLPQKGMQYSNANAQEIVFNDGKQRMNGFQVNFGLMF